MKNSRASAALVASDRRVIDGSFLDHLCGRGLSESTIQRVRWAVRHAARWLARRQRSLLALPREHIPTMLAASTPIWWSLSAQKDYKAGLAYWLRFRDPTLEQTKPKPPAAWQPWIDDFIQFMDTHRGLAKTTQRAYADTLRDYLRWQFGRAKADWQRIQPKHIWAYAQEFRRGRKAGTLNKDLRQLRRFFTFLQMRGAISSQLVRAVPRFSNFGQTTHPNVLNDRQRRVLLESFDRSTPLGSRNYCVAMCMVDLGLRPIEVVQLSLTNFDWRQRVITIPKTKTETGRQLPLTDHIVKALCKYVQHDRPITSAESLFVRYDKGHYGAAMDSGVVRRAIQKAFRRCNFPGHWRGSYCLRHTFATRLHARGAGLKQIADLLGHRQLQTTTLYVKIDVTALRALAFPWPIQS